MTPEDISAGLQSLFPWFQRIDLGLGLFTKTQSAIGEPVEHPGPTWETIRVRLPDDIAGKTVLDVGCNAGFYSIELKRRGAARVLGIDSQRDLIRQAMFVRKVLDLDIEYRRMSVYDLDPLLVGQFDITLALGLIYHCKHLVLALEKLFLVTREMLILETAIYPPDKLPESFSYEVGGTQPTLHPIAYIENEPDAKEAIYNWFLPGVDALRALLKNVGFDEVTAFPGVLTDRAVLICRKHQPFPDSRTITYLKAELALGRGPSTCRPGVELRFTIRVRNTGQARWLRGVDPANDPGAIHLVVHLLTARGESLSQFHDGAYLPHDVLPGETVDILILVRAPYEVGSYILEFDMLSAHLAWFEDLGSGVLRHRLIVATGGRLLLQQAKQLFK